jgi:hypothetical protein
MKYVDANSDRMSLVPVLCAGSQDDKTIRLFCCLSRLAAGPFTPVRYKQDETIIRDQLQATQECGTVLRNMTQTDTNTGLTCSPVLTGKFQLRYSDSVTSGNTARYTSY